MNQAELVRHDDIEIPKKITWIVKNTEPHIIINPIQKHLDGEAGENIYKWTPGQCVAFGVLLNMQTCKEEVWVVWAEKWLNGNITEELFRQTQFKIGNYAAAAITRSAEKFQSFTKFQSEPMDGSEEYKKVTRIHSAYLLNQVFLYLIESIKRITLNKNGIKVNFKEAAEKTQLFEMFFEKFT